MDTNTKREIENFVSHLQNLLIFHGLLQLDINSYIRTLQQKRVTDESRLINVTDGKVIGLSTNTIWRNMASAEKNVFVIYARQIRSSIRN
ncbi:hypothetical protein C2G38_2212296 [Gigaspora rosea]|uniref:Uncharacterized protein n=1 Tax=Gigaspora rosea TaxID=44941 RepID=A0A397ULD0_9GLOM|nr:hypothetical protein C2G38_2212296 [Gigaspora rosea]